MKILAIIVAKIVGFFGSLLGRGSALPGKIALSIDKKILGKLDLPMTVMVSGTNGKTSVSHFSSQILGQRGEVIHNAEGANMPQGIASVLLKNVSLSGKLKGDFVVLEVDEAYLERISSFIRADYLILTNISKDQEDRFTSLDMVEKLLAGGIRKGTRLIINANDPSLVNLVSSYPNEKIYYGVDMEAKEASFNCPSCGNKLKYSKGYYGNIGKFSCSCGLESPIPTYEAENIDLNEGSFYLDGYRFSSPYKADYMIFNLMAAISLGKEMGISNEEISKAISFFEIGGGRMERISFAGKETIFNLVKNPAGLSRTLEFISKDEEAYNTYNIYLALNKRPADGEDLSWLRDVDFSSVRPNKFVIGGEAKEEAREILKSMGVEIKDLSLEDLKMDKEKTYFLSNYTAMNRLKEEIRSLEEA